jgi:hypothetical protein
VGTFSVATSSTGRTALSQSASRLAHAGPMPDSAAASSVGEALKNSAV